MISDFFSRLNGTSPVSVVVISVAIMLFSGFLATRVTKPLRLPNVTAYILVGVALGPCCLNVIPSNIIVGTEFISDIALAFIAFSSGEFFKFELLRANGVKLMVITLFESLMASLFVFVLSYWILRLGLPFSIILTWLPIITIWKWASCTRRAQVWTARDLFQECIWREYKSEGIDRYIDNR